MIKVSGVSDETQKRIEQILLADGRFASMEELLEAFCHQVIDTGAVLFDETIVSTSNDPIFLTAPLNKIHPCKRKIVKYIMDTAPDTFDQVIVFGSAITPYCRTTSDIDLCILFDEEHYDDYRSWARTLNWFAKDIIHMSVKEFQETDRGVVKEIKEKGIRIA